MTMRLILMNPSHQRSAKSTLYPQMKRKPLRIFLKKIWLLERSALQTLLKHLPSSLSRKRMTNSVLIKTIDTSMDIHTTHDAYPLPLISNLVDKLKDASHFTKFDIH